MIIYTLSEEAPENINESNPKTGVQIIGFTAIIISGSMLMLSRRKNKK